MKFNRNFSYNYFPFIKKISYDSQVVYGHYRQEFVMKINNQYVKIYSQYNLNASSSTVMHHAILSSGGGGGGGGGGCFKGNWFY